MANLGHFHDQAAEAGRRSDAEAKAAGAADKAEVARKRAASRRPYKVYNESGHTQIDDGDELKNDAADYFDL